MIEGKTSTGFEFQVDEVSLNDMEFLEILVDVTGGSKAMFPAFLMRFFGAEQKKRLYDHCRNEEGRVPIDAVEKEVANVLEAIKNGGNNEVKN